jgi:hypothetical protein
MTGPEIVVEEIRNHQTTQYWRAPLGDSAASHIRIISLAVSGDGQRAAALFDSEFKGGSSQILEIFSSPAATTQIAEGKEIYKLVVDDSKNGDLAFDVLKFTSDGKYLWGEDYTPYYKVLVCCGRRDIIPKPVLYAIGSKVERLSLPETPPIDVSGRLTMTVSRDARYVATLSSNSTGPPTILVYDLPRLSVVKSLKSPEKSVSGVFFSPDGNDLVVTGSSALYTIIPDWRADLPAPFISIPWSDARGQFPRSHEVAFIPALDAIVVTGTIGYEPDVEQNQHSPFAVVRAPWRSKEALTIGRISNLGVDINQ